MPPTDDGQQTSSPDDPWDRLVQDAFDLMEHPATPVAPHYDTDDDPVRDIADETECVMRALRVAVNKTPDSYLIQAGSSAFHIQPLLRELCVVFERPVKTISISDDGYVIVRLATGPTAQGEACLAMGPHGEGARYIRGEQSQSHGFISSETAAVLGAEEIERLVEAGLKSRE